MIWDKQISDTTNTPIWFPSDSEKRVVLPGDNKRLVIEESPSLGIIIRRVRDMEPVTKEQDIVFGPFETLDAAKLAYELL